MTGPYQTPKIIFRKSRIEKLTKEGLSTRVIAERMGMNITGVYEVQVRCGLRTPTPRKGGKNDISKTKSCNTDKN